MKKQFTFTINNPLYNVYNWFKQNHICSHEEWDCDTQIRAIKCRKCGKMAWIKDYRDLYSTKA